MNWGALLLLAVVVIVAAFLLGLYLRRQDGLGTPPAPLSAARLFGSTSDREEQAVINWLLSQAFEQTGVRVAEDKLAYQRVVEAAKKALQELKSQSVVTISLPFLAADANGPKHFEIRLTRDVIKELVRY